MDRPSGHQVITPPPKLDQRGPRWKDGPCRYEASNSSHLTTPFVDQLERHFVFGWIETDSEGKVLHSSSKVKDWFPDCFENGISIEEGLSACFLPIQENDPDVSNRIHSELFKSLLRGGSLRKSIHRESAPRIFNYLTIPASEKTFAHLFIDFESEKNIAESYKSDLKHLASMREIIDLLYESMSVSEVIDLILVAVTASRGLGFNRAFFLEIKDGHLQGRRGIGPASVDEAREIWSQLDERSPSLRETLNLLSTTEGTPDPATQDLVKKIDLSLIVDENENSSSEISKACLEMKPARLIRDEVESPIDNALFESLGSSAFAVVPLNVQDRLAGVLIADNFITGQEVSEEHLNLLRTFSRYAAIALERSSLLYELTDNNHKLRQANRELQTHQRKLLHAEKLSALGKMAACVSHEIRNPLTAIGGLARSVHDDESISEESREDLKIIVNEVERLERFLKETLNFVKPLSGPFEPADVKDVLGSVIQTFKDSIIGCGIDLVVEMPEEPMVSSLNTDLLRGAVSNLIKNAREALGDQGTLGVHVSKAGGLAIIEVGDTGIGIPETIKDMIFEPFFTNKDDGTGIGLAITQQNVRGLHGSIELTSDERYKTLFKIKIPL